MALDPIVSALDEEFRRKRPQKEGKVPKLPAQDSKQYAEDEFIRVRLVEYQMLDPERAPENFSDKFYNAVKKDIFEEFKGKFGHEYKGRYNSIGKKG